MNEKLKILLQKYQAAGAEKRAGMLEVLHITDEEIAHQLEREIRWSSFRQLPFDAIVQLIAAQQKKATEQVALVVREYLFNNMLKVEELPLDLGQSTAVLPCDQPLMISRPSLVPPAQPEPVGEEISIEPPAYVPEEIATTSPPELPGTPSKVIEPSVINITTVEEPVDSETDTDRSPIARPASLSHIGLEEEAPAQTKTDPAEEQPMTVEIRPAVESQFKKGLKPRI